MRRKGGRYVYIICSKNPKHKQRYVELWKVRSGLWSVADSSTGKDRVWTAVTMGNVQLITSIDTAFDRYHV